MTKPVLAATTGTTVGAVAATQLPNTGPVEVITTIAAVVAVTLVVWAVLGAKTAKASK